MAAKKATPKERVITKTIKTIKFPARCGGSAYDYSDPYEQYSSNKKNTEGSYTAVIIDDEVMINDADRESGAIIRIDDLKELVSNL